MQGNITDWGKEVKKGLIERGWSINDLAEKIRQVKNQGIRSCEWPDLLGFDCKCNQ